MNEAICIARGTQLAKLLNWVLFQAGWFSCVLGAAYGKSFLGVVFVGGILVLHLAVSSSRRQQIVLLSIVGLTGFCVDSGQGWAGLMSFHVSGGLSRVAPLWLVAMWLNFVPTLESSMSWLLGRYWLGMIFGLAGGPLAYYAGNRLGAVEFTAPLPIVLSTLAVVWASVIPLILWLKERLK